MRLLVLGLLFSFSYGALAQETSSSQAPTVEETALVAELTAFEQNTLLNEVVAEVAEELLADPEYAFLTKVFAELSPYFTDLAKPQMELSVQVGTDKAAWNDPSLPSAPETVFGVGVKFVTAPSSYYEGDMLIAGKWSASLHTDTFSFFKHALVQDFNSCEEVPRDHYNVVETLTNELCYKFLGDVKKTTSFKEFQALVVELYANYRMGVNQLYEASSALLYVSEDGLTEEQIQLKKDYHHTSDAVQDSYSFLFFETADGVHFKVNLLDWFEDYNTATPFTNDKPIIKAMVAFSTTEESMNLMLDFNVRVNELAKGLTSSLMTEVLLQNKDALKSQLAAAVKSSFKAYAGFLKDFVELDN